MPVTDIHLFVYMHHYGRSISHYKSTRQACRIIWHSMSKHLHPTYITKNPSHKPAVINVQHVTNQTCWWHFTWLACMRRINCIRSKHKLVVQIPMIELAENAKLFCNDNKRPPHVRTIQNQDIASIAIDVATLLSCFWQVTITIYNPMMAGSPKASSTVTIYHVTIFLARLSSSQITAHLFDRSRTQTQNHGSPASKAKLSRFEIEESVYISLTVLPKFSSIRCSKFTNIALIVSPLHIRPH